MKAQPSLVGLDLVVDDQDRGDLGVEVGRGVVGLYAAKQEAPGASEGFVLCMYYITVAAAASSCRLGW